MRQNTLFWGLVLILAGGVLLLDNLGILQVNVWNILWPLFLIALGAWILWGTVSRRSPAVEHSNVPLDGAGRARIRFRHGAGRLQVQSGAGMADLAEGDFGGGLDLRTRREGDLLNVDMAVPVQFFPIFWSPGFSLDWSVRLNRDTPLALELNTGAGESRLDLSDLRVAELSLHSGASSTELTLPANAGQTRARIETGAASVRVHIPAGVAARIRAGGGLSSINIDATRFPRMGELYQSHDFDTANNRVDLDIQTGVGSIEIR